jgi:hypothetical protein
VEDLDLDANFRAGGQISELLGEGVGALLRQEAQQFLRHILRAIKLGL